MYGIYGLHEPDSEARPAGLPDRHEAGPSCYLAWLRAQVGGEASSAELAVHRPDGSAGWIATE